jgi:TolB-like protein
MRGETPVLAVLPFAASGDESDALLARGLVEDISGELTRFRALAVISPVSAATVAELPDRDAGERLGASHVLRGSLRRLGERLRVSVSLVECAGGTQLWAEQIEAAEAGFFEIGADVVGRIAASLAARLEDTALAEARRRPTGSLAAYGLTVRGLALLRQGTAEADTEARALFERALALDPAYARAHAGLALSWFNEFSCRFWDRIQENGRRAYAHAHEALALDDRDAALHVVVAKVLLFRRAFDRAAWYLDRALALCPHDAELLIQMSLCEVYLGRPALAVEHADKAMRLNPYHPNHYYAFAAIAHAAARDFAGAARLAGPIGEPPILDVPAYLAAALAHLGRLDEGRAWLGTYAAMYRDMISHAGELRPGEACGWLLAVNPYRRDEDRELLAEGFRLLGQAAAAPTPVPGRGVRRGEAGRTDADQAEPGTEESALVRQGAGWLAVYAGRRALLPELKGLHDIHRLLAQAGDAIHCLDLADRAGDAFLGDAALDERARAQAKARIRDLQAEIDEAEAMHDTGRAERARAEMDRLVAALARALGLGGRGRRLGDAAEKARTAVTWRIRHAVRKIAAAHPELGRHLANSLRTGTFCTYQPERAVAWRLVARDDSRPRAGVQLH